MTLDRVEESIRFLLSGAVDYEFRTTIADELHDAEDFTAIGKWLQTLDPDHKAKNFFLQPYVDRDSVLVAGFHTPSKEKTLSMAAALTPCVQKLELRGMD